MCYGRLIGENCTTVADTCIDNNAECSGVDGVCECIPPFTFNASLDICVGPNLDDPCDADSCGSGLTCGSTSQRCECLSPRLQIDNVCYGTRIGEICTTAENTCIDDNANCSGGVCACNPGFTWNHIICVGKELDDPCDNSNVSCLANGLVCGPEGKCECPDDEVQIQNQCFSLTCESCDDDDDCLGDHQVCEDHICKCDTDFYLDNCGECKHKVGDQGACDDDEQCQSGFCICGICQENDDDDCCDDCDEFIADIIFVLDNSGSIGSSNYPIQIAFVITLINEFLVSPTDAQIGVVDYSTGINEDDTFNMDEFTDNLAITQKVTENGYETGWTRTDLALDRAVFYFNSAADRPSVDNYAIVITDGNTNNGGENNIATSASNLKNVATVYAVGIGDGIAVSELQLIASDNSKVFIATDFDTLDEITADLLASICGDD
ncbi:matrilin-2-like [Mercenaria mercenaria]|uniref:matrilin-2-like n=1 Tax=Mercenaria mercenaria TaxID=6596 RepID=UPI00234F7A9F|nr:matrilin-2-like [Mercenaria mercenaria]